MISDILRQIPPQIFPLLKMAARLMPGKRAEIMGLIQGLTALESSQISELDQDVDTLVNALAIRPECYDSVAEIVRKYRVQPTDFVGRLLLRILREDQPHLREENDNEIVHI